MHFLETTGDFLEKFILKNKRDGAAFKYPAVPSWVCTSLKGRHMTLVLSTGSGVSTASASFEYEGTVFGFQLRVAYGVQKAASIIFVSMFSTKYFIRSQLTDVIVKDFALLPPRSFLQQQYGTCNRSPFCTRDGHFIGACVEGA